MNDYRLNWMLPASPLGPALRSPTIVIDHKAMELDAFRFGSHEVSKRAVAPAVAPSVRPVAEPASTREFRVGDRVRVLGSSPSTYCKPGMRGVVVGGPVGCLDIRFEDGDCFYADPAWLELIPAQPEQVAESPAAASDGEWKTRPPTERGWYIASRGARFASTALMRWWNGDCWSGDEHIATSNRRSYSSLAAVRRDIAFDQHEIVWSRPCTPAEIGE